MIELTPNQIAYKKNLEEMDGIFISEAICFTPKQLEAHNLEQTRKGFWLGFEDARCHPDEMNILKQWEGTKVFNEALKEDK